MYKIYKRRVNYIKITCILIDQNLIPAAQQNILKLSKKT